MYGTYMKLSLPSQVFTDVLGRPDAADLADPSIALSPWTSFTSRWLAAATAATSPDPGSMEAAAMLRAATEVWEAILAAIQADLPSTAAAALLASAALCLRLPDSCHLIAGKVAAIARTRFNGGHVAARAAIFALGAAVTALHATDWDAKAATLTELRDLALSAPPGGEVTTQCAAIEIFGALAAHIADDDTQGAAAPSIDLLNFYSCTHTNTQTRTHACKHVDDHLINLFAK